MLQQYDDTGHFNCFQIRVDPPLNTESLGPEPLGSKRKFWVLLQGETQPWLFKYARPGSGEHWAEKLGSELAGLLELPAARVEMAMKEEHLGVLVESIVPHVWNTQLNQVERSGELIHGNEVLAGHIKEYDLKKQRGHRQHSYANIVEALRVAVPESRYKEVMTNFAGLLVLDALIGNTDRHHENWALLRLSEGGGSIVLAPSYDHASSLGRELQDERRAALLDSGIGTYIEKGRGAIFGQSTGDHPDNPLELVRWAKGHNPEWFHSWLERAQRITTKQVDELLARMPETVMSHTARQFCRAFLCYTLDALKGV